MLEQAVVEKIIEKRKSGDLVLLKKLRPDACGHCNGKILCGVKENFTFRAINHSSSVLKEGDLVKYLLPNISVIKLSFMVYSIPLLVFLVIILMFSWLYPNHELFSVLIGVIAMFLSFFLIGWFDRKNKSSDRRLPKIQEIINR
ncbi:MAG: sigma-E factor negative regulatory protein RseC [Thermotogaceae bacterium]|jgi:positive regulator of sigma E activity|nr:sigma-E factor negative regulatory protein RseC [Thermotogaceae bacterium]